MVELSNRSIFNDFTERAVRELTFGSIFGAVFVLPLKDGSVLVSDGIGMEILYPETPKILPPSSSRSFYNNQIPPRKIEIPNPQSSQITSIIYVKSDNSIFYSLENKIFLKSLSTPEQFYTFSFISLPFYVTCLCYFEDDKILCAGLVDGSVRLWDVGFGYINSAFERKSAKFLDKRGKVGVMLMDSFRDTGFGHTF